MSDWTVIRTRLRGGEWEAVVTGPATGAPDLALMLLDRRIEGLRQELQAPGQWRLRAAIPADCLTEGVQSFGLWDQATGERIGGFTLIAGAPLEGDLRAEIELLRSEVELLKRMIRRHLARPPG